MGEENPIFDSEFTGIALMQKLAVYIHWPYCARICPYCDFNVYKGEQNDALVKAIIRDLSYWRDMSGPRQISSIHFGGGTPSLMKADDVRAMINKVDELWNLPKDAENPFCSCSWGWGW